MIHSDVIVIGSGLAGLVAALASAERKKTVTLLTYGEGTFPLNSGLIDILGYDANGSAVKSPLEAIAGLPPAHPYHRIGQDALEKAVEFFLDFTDGRGYGYVGSLNEQKWVPTAMGTMKPTCLVPQTMQGASCFAKRRIIIVGVKALKDFYADTVAHNLPAWLGEDKEYRSVELETGFEEGRDITTMDVARWLDTKAGTRSVSDQLKPVGGHDAVFIMPQILGTKRLAAYEKLTGRLETDIVEATSMPPSTNGMRLRNLLRSALHEKGVDIVENTKVLGASCQGGHCTNIVAQASVREKSYYADKFILATGGLYSGGITMRDFNQPKEMIFGLPVFFEEDEDEWSNAQLFSGKPQGFARTGIVTDDSLRPVDGDGKPLLDNVFIVGRNLAGYDFCFEQSGNGVALGSAYKAAMA